jgi:hypothetical protein
LFTCLLSDDLLLNKCEDVDGATVHIEFPVINGFVNSLEIYKEDGPSPCGLSAADALGIFAADSADAGVWTMTDTTVEGPYVPEP